MDIIGSAADTVQSRWVINHFNGKRDGFFLDLGAGVPVRGSNTYILEKVYGWDGLCVDALPEFVADLLANRKCQVKQAVVSDIPGAVNFCIAECLSGIDDDYTAWAKNRVKDSVPNRVVSLQAITFEWLFAECKVPLVIDYWSLDTEGSELRLLKCFPWDKHEVKLLTVEHNGEEPRRTEIREFMFSKGYELDTVIDHPYEDFFILV